VAFADFYRGKRVLLTGHTGFKGSWLAEWLLALGADITGLSLPPPQPALFDQLGLVSRLHHTLGDIRDCAAVREILDQVQPDFVFHLAAQPLVRLSYAQPVETYATNVMGTVHVLEALRTLERPCVAILVTTDKCYENREWVHGYREEDPMGGFDPYSSSKGMAELAVAAYRRSFFAAHPVKLATARAGNVIGGGDWALDRIVPDSVRALQRGEPIAVRNPHATRPWQHVLEPLSGYLQLAAALHSASLNSQLSTLNLLGSAFNFGPGHDANRTVGQLVEEIFRHWPGEWLDESDPHAVHEARLLQLATDKAHALLQWSPVWRFPDSVRETITWYRAAQNASQPLKLQALTQGQIDSYTAAAREAGLPWAQAA
jgi:CDP-glucose 4,6-dehydratase